MKKLITTLAITGILNITAAQADVIGFEVGTSQWTPEYSGTVSSDSSVASGSQVNIRSDLGYNDDSHNILWAKLEHPLPIIPNIKLVSSDLATTANAQLSRSITFSGQMFDSNQAVSSNFDMSNTEYTFYYEILDNWVNLDLGVTLRKYDGKVQLRTTSGTARNELEQADFTLPLFYAAARADLPFSGFFVDAEVNVTELDNDSVSDTTIGFGYESDSGLGAKAGYRTFDMQVKEDDFKSDLKFDGAYVSIFYHF